MVQIGADADRAKVFKAHAAPLGLCDNLITALKLLANQQKYGDSPIQSIVTGLYGRSRKEEPEAAIREGADELTLRAEEVGTLKSCINIDHIEDDRWRPPLVDADWHALCQAVYPGIEGEEWEDLYCHCREMSRAAGVKKPSESQKARVL